MIKKRRRYTKLCGSENIIVYVYDFNYLAVRPPCRQTVCLYSVVELSKLDNIMPDFNHYMIISTSTAIEQEFLGE